MIKKTKIVATLGPASDNEETMEAMVKAGVNVFRLNFSHGTHEYHKSNIDKIRNIEKRLNKRIGILQDICGPKIRVGKLSEPFYLKAGDELSIYAEDIVGEKIEKGVYRVSLNQPQILPMLKAGEYVYLYDGSIRARVIGEGKDVVKTIIENDGILNSNKGVNFPNTALGIDIITPKDKEDMEFGAKQGVNFVAISFVQDANDVIKARNILKEFGSKAAILSKIEKFDAVENIDDIIAKSDGIMVARGDLGIEVPFYKAVLDGTDAVMLSEESAIGKNPVAVVEAMSKTIIQTQSIYPYNKFDEFDFFDETDMVANSAASLAVRIKANAILSITGSGKSAIKLARNRTNIDIIAIAHDEQTAHMLTLAWGVTPALVLEKTKLNVLLANVIKKAYDAGYVEHDKTYLVTAGHPTGVEGSTNLIRIIRRDQLDYYLDLATE